MVEAVARRHTDVGILKCAECGIPRLISLMHRWRDDGVLESRMGGARGIAGMVAAVCGDDRREYDWEVPEPDVVRVRIQRKPAET